MNDVLSLPFDQYQRYRLVADLVGQVRVDGEPLRILDVGGRTAILRSFLPQDRVELVDLEPSDVPGLVLGDGSRLPFLDGAFDVVAAFDTLEHVPPDRRDAFVDECARVSRGWVLVAGPYRTPEVDEAEELLRAFLESKLQLRHRYLEEHRSHGLPVRRAVEERFGQRGAEVRSFGHGNLDRWVALMCMEMYMDADPGLRPIASRFFRFYNERLYASDHALPVYRHVVVAALRGKPLPDGAGLLEAPVAPAEALPPIQRLVDELLVFDSQRDVWEPEFERLKGELAALEADLDGHRRRLAEKDADLIEHRASLSELQGIHAAALEEHAHEQRLLREDLAQHAASLAELRATLERQVQEQAQEKAAFEADLEQHDQALAASRSLEQDLRGQIAGLDAAAVELREHLARTEEGAQAIQEELVGARADIAGLLRELEGRDVQIATLSAELRDRVANLKRVFARKKWGD